MSEHPSGPSEWSFDVEEPDFERAVIERSHQVPVVVDFWATWCAPCRALGPVLERLVEERAGAVLLARVEVDRAQDLAAHFAVQSIPTVLAIVGGQVVDEFRGALGEPEIRAFLDRLQPSAADTLVSTAAGCEEADAAEAETLYRRALESDPTHPSALLGLARLVAARGDDDAATELLERLGPGGELKEEVDRVRSILLLRRTAAAFGDRATVAGKVAAAPENAELRYQLGCLLAADGDYEGALAELLAAARQDKELARARVREAMVSVFYIVGARSALADDYRSQLASALY